MSVNNFYTNPNAGSSPAELSHFSFERMLSGKYFIEIVKVTAVSGTAPNLVVTVLPLVARRDASGAMISNSVVYNCPVWRLQRGTSGVIMNPVVGDIGMAAVADSDTSLVRANLVESLPGSKRRNSLSDAIYLGGLLNAEPTQYVEFADGAINIVSPSQVNVTAPVAVVTSTTSVTVDTPTATFSGNVVVDGNVTAKGDITDNSGTQSASVKALRDAYDAHTHTVSGVESGSSTVTSATTSNSV